MRALVLGLALLAVLTGCSRQAQPPPSPAPQVESAPTRTRGTAVGQEAPEFRLLDLDGQAVQLSDYRGQVVLLNFWATWCDPCRVEIPGLVSAYESYKSRGFTVVAVNLGEPREQVKAFAGRFEMSFPVLLDPGGQARNLYPTRGIPISFILDREGVVRRVLLGAMDEETIVELIEPLL